MKQGLLFILALLCLSCDKQALSTGPYRTVADKNATESTHRLYSSLFLLAEKGVMLGHQDALANDSDMKTVCGDYPAVFGWDLECLETDSCRTGSECIRQNVRQVHRLGGISTLSWKAGRPEIKPGGKNRADSLIEAVLPGKPAHEAYLSQLDQLADFFLSLKDDKGNLIPVIFRPFPSANDSKYWWNRQQNTSGQYKQLWRMTVDYLRNVRKVNNLIYTYSVSNVKNPDELAACYPGNDYVDIVGSEVYFSLDTDPDGKVFKQDLERNLAVITAFSKRNQKIPSLTETGLEGIKVFNFFSDYVYPIVTKYPISYMLFWKNTRNSNMDYFIPVPGHPACEDFIYFVNQPEILTCTNI
ncbi:MAG: glycoside hydrolase family 26 protein [Dysgonamonadaceae bacterium]|jgi:hypothetical protein|nr:glycoside hydrolase family 26 protein [Dysgonamonadaceae bacterium]